VTDESTYVYDQSWTHERKRLAGIEAQWDPVTIRQLERIGVGEGWSCLEVGGGGGSMAEWLAARVGPGGAVTATDLDTRFLDALDIDNLTVLAHNLLEDPPPGEYDVVHARLLVEHLPFDAALDALLAAVKPGGHLLVEDLDHVSAVPARPAPELDKAQEAILGFMAQAGFDAHCGRRLWGALRERGLADVHAEGSVSLLHAGTPGIDFYRFSLEALGPALVEKGALTQGELDSARGALDDPDFAALSAILVSASGRRTG
jgi:SAM-dependent methyltransferase